MDFSLYFTQLSVGCVGLLPVVPWRAVGKGYYVMMLAIGFGLMAMAWFFRSAALFPPGRNSPLPAMDVLCILLFAAYLAFLLAALGSFLWGSGPAGSRLSAWCAAMGVLAVVVDAIRVALHLVRIGPLDDPNSFIPPPAQPALLAFNFLSGALLLGSVLSAMLLGHWYLVVKDLPVEPLKRLTRIFFGALAARLAATVAAFLLDPEGGRAVVHRSFLFVLVYGLFSLGSPIGMSWMIWGTVRIRSTQAATGILYGVTAFILMGEAAGRFVLIKTGFPL